VPKPELQCPFCEQTSHAPQGLAAHIRSRHPKQYPKWLKTPSRLADAQKSSAPPEAPEQVPEPPAPLRAAGSEAPVLSKPATNANPALDLLKKAHVELVNRRKSIEAELARQTDLTMELEAVKAQIQALDTTLKVFEPKA
jgi:hypothetical protein